MCMTPHLLGLNFTLPLRIQFIEVIKVLLQKLCIFQVGNCQVDGVLSANNHTLDFRSCTCQSFIQIKGRMGPRINPRGTPDMIGTVFECSMPLFIFWLIFLLDLELNFIGKLLVFRWELIMLLLLQICCFFCYERDFMKSLSRENQADIIEAFISTFRYLDDFFFKY